MSDYVQYHLRLKADQMKKLKTKAKKEEKDVADLMRDAIRVYLETPGM